VAGNVRNTLCRVKKVRYTLARNLISAAAVIVRTSRSRVGYACKLCNGGRLRHIHGRAVQVYSLMDYLIRNE